MQLSQTVCMITSCGLNSTKSKHLIVRTLTIASLESETDKGFAYKYCLHCFTGEPKIKIDIFSIEIHFKPNFN